MEKEFNENQSLKEFQEEIKEVAEKETAAHFKHGTFNPEELTEDDRIIWEKVKDETVSREDLDTYRESVGGESETRRVFLAFINNKALVVFLAREIEKRKK